MPECSEIKYLKTIKEKYNYEKCPTCCKNFLSLEEHHIVPQSFHKRKIFSNKIFTSDSPECNSQIRKYVNLKMLKNGLKTKGLWCKECENYSARLDDIFIKFWDNNTRISSRDLIKFISITCIRFYLYALKPRKNLKTQLFCNKLINTLRMPSQRFFQFLLSTRDEIDNTHLKIYVCRVDNTQISLLLPKLHFDSEKIEDQRVTIFMGDMLFNIFIKDIPDSFVKFLGQIGIKPNNFLSLQCSTKNIYKDQFPIITTKQMEYIIGHKFIFQIPELYLENK